MKTPTMSSDKLETIGEASDTLGSQINISIFLGLLILTIFVMPSIWVWR
jgi:hypothetical protein